MRHALLTAVTMVAFAANSLLNRMALVEGSIGASEFALIRVASGAAVLALLLVIRDKAIPAPRAPDWGAVAGLSAYMLGFSFAYVSMDAGLGALILFAGVQVTMFAGALLGGERPPARRWGGMAIALAGLAVLSWPGAEAVAPPHAVALMGAAAVGWGVYSLIGRRVTDPLAATGWNFLYALPVAAVAFAVLAGGAPVISAPGVLLAVISAG